MEFTATVIRMGKFQDVQPAIMQKTTKLKNQKSFFLTCKTPFCMIYYKYPREGGGDFSPPLLVYHQRIAVIRAASATTALITISAISKAVGFFCLFIASLPFLSVIILYTQWV